MPVDPFTAWLLIQALGPELISRGLDSLGRRSWRQKLAASVSDNAPEKVSTRRIRRWLDEPATWDDLVALTSDAVERLKESLSRALRPRIIIRKERYEAERLRRLADQLVPVAIGEFLVALEPSYATSVAHYREMAAISSLRGQVDQILEAIDVDRDLPDLLARVPPTAEDPIEDLVRASKPACASLLKSILGAAEGPAVAVDELVRVPPAWLEAAPPSAWLALGEIASGHGRHSSAAKAFEKAADSGAPNRALHLARAALEASTDDRVDEARRLCDLAASVTGERSAFVDLATAAVEKDVDSIIRVTSEYPADAPSSFLMSGIKGNVHYSRREWDLAIAAYEEQLRRQPRAAGAAIMLARVLLARATEGQSPSWQSDVRRARELALKGRDLRREWLGPSEEAVVLACQAAITAHAWEKAIKLGLAAPDGDATDSEASAQKVLTVVASASIAANRFDILERIVNLLTNPFERAFHVVHLHEGQGRPRDELISEYEECWRLAEEADQKLAVQLGLASLGHWPIPGFEELTKEHPEEADSVAALSESVRGLYDNAIRRLRKWTSSPRAQRLLVNLLQESGNVDDAIKVARDCRTRFDDPLFGIMAARLLASQGKLDEADREARNSLVGIAKESEAAIELTYLLIEFAANRLDWREIESLARKLSSADPQDSKARWWWLLALFNQGKVDDAWRVLNDPEPVWPHDETQARLWLELHRRFGKGSQAIQRALDLAAEYEESEEIRAGALFLAYEISRDIELPETTLKHVHSATESFLTRFPESTLFRKIEFAEIEELVSKMREFLEPGTKQYEELKKAILFRWFPYAVLSAFLNRPYAEALLMRAAGCLPQEIQEDNIRDLELRTVQEAIDQEVVVDVSVLTTASVVPELWNPLLSAFSRVLLATATNRDIQEARARLAIRSTTSMAWDASQEKPRAVEISQELADRLADQAEWVAKAASQLTLVDVRDMPLFPDLDLDRWSASLAAVQLANEKGIPLFSADAGLRLLARAFGVEAFGVGGLIDLLRSRGELDDNAHKRIVRELRRNFVVDLKTTKPDVVEQAEEDGWNVGPAAYVLTRAAFWRDPRAALDTYKEACFVVASKNPEALAGWVGSAVYGAGLGRDSHGVTSVAGPLLVYAVLATEFDADAFPRLLEAARWATKELGGSDPLPTITNSLIEAFREHFHPQVAAQLALAVIQKLPDADREVALRVILDAGST